MSPTCSWRTGIREIAEEELLRLQREVGAEADLLLEAGEPARVICSAAARVGAGTVIIGRGSAAGISDACAPTPTPSSASPRVRSSACSGRHSGSVKNTLQAQRR